ncbi:MAG: TIGR03435 family protein [Bryobacteraceae bacterium]
MMNGPMLRELLEERVRLKFHRKTREVPIYLLTVAKSGLKLQPPDVPRPQWLCPQCCGAMAILERFTAVEARFRSPPHRTSSTTMTCSFSSRTLPARERQQVRTARSLLDRTTEHRSILQPRLPTLSTYPSAPISSSSATTNTVQNA